VAQLYHAYQWCQSGLKSGGRGSRQKKSIFPGKFPKNFGQFHEEIDFSRQISKKFRFFQAISQKKFDFKAKIGHLQQLLGKLLYFSSKVTTFKETSCT